MNAERLLALYERVAEAPDAIARLRRFILDLAVRGKLVPQDPQDEPASEMLKRIAKEKARLVKEGKAKRQDVLPEADLHQSPFELPARWAWGRFPELGTLGRGKCEYRLTCRAWPIGRDARVAQVAAQPSGATRMIGRTCRLAAGS